MNSPNRLSSEKSPYLLQHRLNPVDWFPWGPEAISKARTEHKPIFLSIGYSTCYWCHVMEKDSFEREEVAKILNANFIPIKVDREERPDIDQIYMEAVVALTGHGGWPMSVFLTPDLKPFWGGTFFYRDTFLNILTQISEAWKGRGKDVADSADRIASALSERVVSSDLQVNDEELYSKAFDFYRAEFDEVNGGFGSAPKFPPAVGISLLLRVYRQTHEQSALEMAERTLEAMARGGIYDHLGGGFARYSTDEKWLVPHFEKMLYDNALLAVSYVEAFQATGNEDFKGVAREVLDYLLREMCSPEGAFWSAQDAGEVGAEGEFYVWRDDEIRRLLTGEEYGALREVFSISAEGNFEHETNVLSLHEGVSWSRRYEKSIAEARKKLLLAREKRPKPLLDDKVLTAWNGLAITAFSRAGMALGDAKYIAAAREAASFLLSKLLVEGKLLRRYRDREARHDGCLDDYSYFVEGLISLYETTGEERWLRDAIKIQSLQDSILWDAERAGYLFSAAPELFNRKVDLIDNATPSGAGVSLGNLIRLYLLTGDSSFRERALVVFDSIGPVAARYPGGAAKALTSLPLLLGGSIEAVIIEVDEGGSEEALELRRLIGARFLPEAVIASGRRGAEFPGILTGKEAVGGQDTLYICRNSRCSLPLTDMAKARESIKTL